MDIRNLCMNCMNAMEASETVCMNCKKDKNESQPEPFAPYRTSIGKRYVLGKGLSQNSEGLSYMGYDFVKETKVYVREFFPCEFCVRKETNEIATKDFPEAAENFNTLLKKFLKYFRSVARLRNLSPISAVYDILEQNNTVYVIFEWVDGVSLGRYMGEHGGRMSWEEARALFMPLLSSLSRMEAAGVRHLGICPENMLVTDENKIKLTGFATEDLRSKGILKTAFLCEGCAALEQYIPDCEISESTDVYGFTATLFFALTGEYPALATERRKKDRLMMPHAVLENLPENVVSGIANALRVYPNSRTISFETLRVELSNSPVLQIKNIYDSPKEFSCTIPSEEKKSNMNAWAVISCLSATVLLLACFGVYWFWLKDKSLVENPSSESGHSDSASSEEKILSEEDSADAHEGKVEVPQLVGKTLSNAQSIATSENPYKVVVLSEEFHESIAKGCIISQTPAFGEEMYPGSIIAVNISKGPEKRMLPSIKGKSISEASLLLTDAGFKPTQVSETNADFSQGTVIGYQGYQAGDMAPCGSEVVIVVSKG